MPYSLLLSQLRFQRLHSPYRLLSGAAPPVVEYLSSDVEIGQGSSIVVWSQTESGDEKAEGVPFQNLEGILCDFGWEDSTNSMIIIGARVRSLTSILEQRIIPAPGRDTRETGHQEIRRWPRNGFLSCSSS